MTIRYEHLLGLEWKEGSQDCYELGRSFFRDNFQIELPPFARPNLWWEHNLNLYMDHFRELGFEVFNGLPRDIRLADVFLMAVHRRRDGPKVANHCGIYVGEGKFLHHFTSRRSTVEPYLGLWQNTTVAIIRHKDVPEPEKTSNRLDLMDILPPAMRMRLARPPEAVPDGG